MNCAVKQIEILDVKYFMFCVYSEEKSLRVSLFNVDHSALFTGTASESDLRCMAAKARLTFNDFYQDMLCALFSLDVENLQFTYMLENMPENCEGKSMFKWKKNIKYGVIITLGYIPVSTSNYNTGLSDFMVKMSIFIHSLNAKQKEMTDELSKINKEKSEVEILLEEAVKVKETMEKEMYTKFCVVLNTKKRKIKELCEKIEELESKKSKPVNAEIPMKVIASSSQYDEALNKPGSSKISKETFESSFILEDSDNEKSVPVVRPRRRKKVAGGKLRKGFNGNEKTAIPNENVTELNHSDEESDDGLLDML